MLWAVAQREADAEAPFARCRQLAIVASAEGQTLNEMAYIRKV